MLRSHTSTLRGVVHSFTGTLAEALELIELGFFIGVNGCSLKTEENLSVVEGIPLGSIMIESDCPWCEIRPSHASSRHLVDMPPDLRGVYMTTMVKKEKFVPGKGVKGRNEPNSTGQVAWVVSKVKQTSVEEVARVTTENALNMFRLSVQDGVWAGQMTH